VSKPKILTISLLVLATSHSLTFWAGQNSNGAATKPTTVELAGIKPSKNQAENACYLSYMRDVSSVPNRSVELVDIKGMWLDVSSSYLCSVKGWHQFRHNSGVIDRTSEQTFFVLREEFVIKPISEAEFRKMSDL